MIKMSFFELERVLTLVLSVTKRGLGIFGTLFRIGETTCHSTLELGPLTSKPLSR